MLPEWYELEVKGFGFRGRLLGTLCVDGMTIAADRGREPFGKIARAWVGGEPLSEDAEYVVGSLDMFTFGVGYTGLKEGRDVRYLLPEFIRDVLAEALADETLVAECTKARWIFME